MKKALGAYIYWTKRQEKRRQQAAPAALNCQHFRAEGVTKVHSTSLFVTLHRSEMFYYSTCVEYRNELIVVTYHICSHLIYELYMFNWYFYACKFMLFKRWFYLLIYLFHSLFPGKNINCILFGAAFGCLVKCIHIIEESKMISKVLM